MRLQTWLQHLHLARRADPPSASWCHPLHSPPRWTLAATRTIVAWSALCTRQNALLYRRCHVTARPTHLRAAAGRTATHRAAPQRAILGAKLAKTNSLTAGSAELRGAEASSATPRAATATVPSIATQQAAWLLPSKAPVQQLQLLTRPRREQQSQPQPQPQPHSNSSGRSHPHSKQQSPRRMMVSKLWQYHQQHLQVPLRSACRTHRHAGAVGAAAAG